MDSSDHQDIEIAVGSGVDISLLLYNRQLKAVAIF